MKPTDDLWQRLVALARRATVVSDDVVMPPGFATRVAALAFERLGERPLMGLFEAFSWRALGLAAGLALASAALNYLPAQRAVDSAFAVEPDPVAIVLDLSR